ncbi:hypothetical protein CR513_34589, partial [Mucuna pruriens]
MSAHLMPSWNQVDQTDSSPVTEKSPSSPPPMELKPLPSHLKYAYLDKEQQLPVIIANNLHQEQEDKLLEVLRQHEKEIGWKLSNLLGTKLSDLIKVLSSLLPLNYHSKLEQETTLLNQTSQL